MKKKTIGKMKLQGCVDITDPCAWLDSYGFYSASGYGDGEYDVYAFKANGEIVSLEIRFL